jgi:hypothetical protein
MMMICSTYARASSAQHDAYAAACCRKENGRLVRRPFEVSVSKEQWIVIVVVQLVRPLDELQLWVEAPRAIRVERQWQIDDSPTPRSTLSRLVRPDFLGAGGNRIVS